MRNKLIALLVLIAVSAMAAAGAETLEPAFERITLAINTMTAQDTTYEFTFCGEDIIAQYSLRSTMWDNEIHDYAVYDDVIRRFTLSTKRRSS